MRCKCRCRCRDNIVQPHRPKKNYTKNPSNSEEHPFYILISMLRDQESYIYSTVPARTSYVESNVNSNLRLDVNTSISTDVDIDIDVRGSS